MGQVKDLHEYKWYIVFFIEWDDYNTADSVEIRAANPIHAERIFRQYYAPELDLFVEDIEIVEATDYEN